MMELGDVHWPSLSGVVVRERRPGARCVTTQDGWEAAQYRRFFRERRQPFDDLLGLCRPVPGGSVVDLGCGSGELTQELHVALGAARTCGVDSSPAMLAQARACFGDAEGLRFVEGDIGSWHGADLDVVFANASLHWVGGHRELLGRLRRCLAARGQLAFQVPANFSHPSHRLAQVVADEEPFASALGARRPEDRGRHVLSPEEYAVVLDDLGAAAQCVRLQVYGHRLESASDVVEWVKGTLLTPYRKVLDEVMWRAFVARYTNLLLQELGDRRPYFYAFPRILCWARFASWGPR